MAASAPHGARAKYGNHMPHGMRKGVQRGTFPNGAMAYNGHRHIPEHTRKVIVDFMAALARPTTIREVACEIGWSKNHVGQVLDRMHTDRLVVRTGHPRIGWLYALPESATADPVDMDRKVCSKCRRTLPRSAFGRDRSQASGIRPDCKRCRSLRPDSYRPYPDRG
jgi:hypothetical protein